jgi:hypothetical protein
MKFEDGDVASVAVDVPTTGPVTIRRFTKVGQGHDDYGRN